MGLGGISIGSLLLIFFIFILLFGTKKLRTMGEDLGHAVRSFRKGLQDPNLERDQKEHNTSSDPSDPSNSSDLSEPKS